MKKLLTFVFVLALLFAVVVLAQAEEEKPVSNDIRVVESFITEVDAITGCKSQAHRKDVYVNGVYVYWNKLTATNSCWGVCMTLGNSSKSHWVAPGWSATWGTSKLGGQGCTTNPIIRFAYDNVYGPDGIRLENYHEMMMLTGEPLDLNWYWWQVRR